MIKYQRYAYVPYTSRWGCELAKPFCPKKMRAVGQLNAWFRRMEQTRHDVGPKRHGLFLSKTNDVSNKTVLPVQAKLGCEPCSATTSAAMCVS